ncbi:MAG: hypothetical protein BJ554DRAFT_4445, partial [Olpidium bornovanus]
LNRSGPLQVPQSGGGRDIPFAAPRKLPFPSVTRLPGALRRAGDIVYVPVLARVVLQL